MIKSLLIKNYALIRHLEMSPATGFNTITGETGAGKSIMLGALGLLLGKRADTRVLFANDEKCIIEGLFNISKLNLKQLFVEKELDYEPECIIRREINTSGKSRAFINDTPVTLEVMKTIGNHLVDIHSQRDTFLLNSPAYQLNIIDSFAQNSSLLKAYNKAFNLYTTKKISFEQLLSQVAEMKKEADYNHFLHKELNEASFQPGEQEALEKEIQIASHAEEISRKLAESLELLDRNDFSVDLQLQDIRKNMAQISKLAEHFQPLNERLESLYYEMQDIISELENEQHKMEFDPGKLEEIQERLDLLYRLQQKHDVDTVAELIEINKRLEKKVDRIQNLDEEVKNGETALKATEKLMLEAAGKLSASRRKALPALKTRLEKLLKKLGMPRAIIQFRHNPADPNPNGADSIQILFSSNTGVPPAELRNVASGGEFSRLMFVIKFILAEKMSLPTIIFDEIDSGISGDIAIKMVEMMGAMSKTHQVIVITHLPQIAAKGHAHYYVYKENKNGQTVSKIKKLSQIQREQEIAVMIGGRNPTKVALENARELLSTRQ